MLQALLFCFAVHCPSRSMPVCVVHGSFLFFFFSVTPAWNTVLWGGMSVFHPRVWCRKRAGLTGSTCSNMELVLSPVFLATRQTVACLAGPREPHWLWLQHFSNRNLLWLLLFPFQCKFHRNIHPHISTPHFSTLLHSHRVAHQRQH